MSEGKGALLCACCVVRDAAVRMNLTEFGLEPDVPFCDWCEESLIEGGTPQDLARIVKERRAHKIQEGQP